MKLKPFLTAAFVLMNTAIWADVPKPKVKFTTSLGSFTVELEPEAAPKTVENFLHYVRKGHYNGTIFHRVISTFMIQGGGHSPELKEKTTGSPIQNEAQKAAAADIKNTRGSIAMARTSAPHSATAQFFINVVDNPNLDYPSFDGWGYCAFGKVVEGMEVVDKIRAVPTGTRQGPNSPMANVPIEPVFIEDAVLIGAQKARSPSQKKTGKLKSKS